MSRWGGRLGFAVLFVTGVTAPSAGQAPIAVRDTTLENGLQVIVMPNHSIPLATLEVVVRAGAFTQLEAEDEGIPHILEHMLFKAYRRGEGFASDAADLGATYNGTTSDERVTYFLTLPSERVEDGLAALGRLMRDPDLGRRDLETERQVVRGELERLASDPYSVLEMTSDMALWGPAFGRKNAIGTVTTILRSEAGRIRDHYRRYYIPSNAALVVSGDVDADDVFEWAEDRLGGWDDRADPFQDFEPVPVQPLERDSAFVVAVPSTDVTLSIKWHGPSVSADPVGTLAADVFSQMFNQANSGAQTRLVDSGIFQLLNMGYTTLENVGPISMRARTTPEQITSAMSALGLELALLSGPTYFDEGDVDAAKKALRVASAIARETGPSAAHSLAASWAVGGLDYYRGYEDGLQAVTLQDVRAYVDRYLAGQPRVIAVIATEELMAPLTAVFGQYVAAWPRSGR